MEWVVAAGVDWQARDIDENAKQFADSGFVLAYLRKCRSHPG